ncbi:hypothetical protein D3C76_25980 [compost metagenome]
MAIREILGADDFPIGARYQTFQLLAKGLMPVPQGATSANTAVAVLNGRTWMRITGRADPYLMGMLSSAKITVDEMKTKKIYCGFRYVTPNSGAKSNDPLLRINPVGPNNTLDVLTRNDFQRATDEVYVKFCIDIPNLLITVWLDGTQIRTVPITGNMSTITDIRIYYGQLSGAAISELHHYNDFYWEVDTFDTDGIQAGKLGPVKVKSVKVAGTVLPGDWSTSDGSDPNAILDASTMAPNTELTPVIRSSPNESVASVGFAKPTAELAIKAVSIEIFGFRDAGTAPTLQAQLKQGTTTGEKKNFIVPVGDVNRGATSDRLGCFPKDLNGAAWTNDTIDALEVLVNSKTGG